MAQIQKRVLLVDDSDLDRMILKTMIEDEFEVIETHNGYFAFEMLAKRTERIDGLLLDISMPIISGFDILQLMKDNQLDDIPVFLITGEATQENVLRASEYKIAEFLSKPFDREEILKRLRAWLGVDLPFDLTPSDIEDTKRYIEELATIYKIHLNIFEKRDTHYKHMVELMRILLTQYVKNNKNVDFSKECIDLVSEAAYFCDIGEMFFPDRLSLALKGTDKGHDLSTHHTEMGAMIIRLNHEPSCKYFVNVCANMCSYHHERYDGRGFPRGLSGKSLSLFNQLCHLVDETDAKYSKLYGNNSLQVKFIIKGIVKDEGLASPELLELLEESSQSIVDYYSKSSY